MWDWICGWFDSEGFPPRWQCGSWPEWLGWLHILADIATFVAYMAIPVVLASLLLRRRDVPFPRVFALFAAFIFACGAVHFVEAMIFWQPIYYLSGLLKGVTAVVSLATVVALVPTVKRAMALPGFQRDTARLASIVSASRDAVISKNLDGTVDCWNRGAELMYGYTAAEMVGKSIFQIVPEDRRQELEILTDRARAGEQIQNVETERLTKDGRLLPTNLTISAVIGADGETVGTSAIARDITGQKNAQRQLEATASRLRRANKRWRELADHDQLTGLCNRRGFEDAVAREIERMRRHGTPAAVVLIDCDDFKSVNDKFGHNGGDEVLREIGQRIEDTVRETDVVARIGGDEFMVLVTDVRVAEAAELADRIRQAVADRSIHTAAGEADVRISCGVEQLHTNHSRLDDLLIESSAALHLAKSFGKNAVEVSGAGSQRVQLPGYEQLAAWAQPIVGVRDTEVVGYEFLIRGPLGVMQNPEQLFRAFRARNQLDELDFACLETCLAAAASVPGEKFAHVNLMPATLLGESSEKAVDLVRRTQLRDRLCIELNEAMLVGEPAELVPRVKQLREATGCRVAIDDVGFGRSSLEALIRLEPNVVKIDRHYVHGISSDRGLRRSLERLVRVGQSLDAHVIAEGVERESDSLILADLNVSLAQGYLFGRPKLWRN